MRGQIVSDAPHTRDLLLLIGALVVVLGVCGGLAAADDASMSAMARERAGYFRGAILDDRGQRLAWSIGRNNSSTRTYALPSLALTVGYHDPAGHWTGIEGMFDSLLTNRPARRDWRTFFLHLRGVPVRGGTVKLTLDTTLQRVAQNALGNVKGAIVALDPSSGAIKAMVSSPACSPVQLAQPRGFQACAEDPSHPMRNRAISDLYSPGSDFKIVTLSAALDTHTFSLHSVFSGANAFGPSPYFNNLEYPSNVTRTDLTQLTLPQALAFSDNFTFAHIGLTLGADRLLDYAHRYYVGKRIPFTFPVTPSQIAYGNPHPSKAILAQSSFGAEPDRVTPLQMALITATVANHGVAMAPYLIDSVRTASGTIVQQTRPRVLSRVMSAQSAVQAATAMKFVVDHGSGFNAQIHGIAVAGKTGTAASGADKPNAWFICFAPIKHPVIAVAVLHQYSGEGFQYAAPLARDVLVAALRERGFRVH